MSKVLERSIDVCYTNLLKKFQKLHWVDHQTFEEIYGNFPRISCVLTSRALRLAGHCFLSKEEIIPDLLIWRPIGPTRSRKLTYLDTPKRETVPELELKTAMADRELWQ